MSKPQPVASEATGRQSAAAPPPPARAWRSWGRTLRAAPVAWARPGSEQQLCDVVGAAADAGRRVKVVGSGHSCSAVASPDGALAVSLEGYGQVLHLDRERLEVTVQAGATLARVVAFLHAHGLALANLGSITAQTVAGAISTGTHGTGLTQPSLDQQVVRLRLVDGRGRVRELSRARDPGACAAARVGLGALGVVSTVTLACVPAFDLRVRTTTARLRDVADLWHSQPADHLRYWWFPHTEQVQVWAADRLPAAARRDGGARAGRWAASVAGDALHASALLAAARWPSLQPAANRLVRRALHHRPRTARVPGWAGMTLPIRLRQRVMEYGLPLEAGHAAVTGLRDLLAARGLRAHLPVEVRCAPAGDAWLGMAYGRPTCYVGVIAYHPLGVQAGYREFFRAADELFATLGGRPHWAKEHHRDAAYLAAAYPRMGDFLRVRADHDPGGIFLNPYLARVLGLG